MNRRRRRPNYFGWTIFGLVVLFGYYFNQVYLPSQPNPFDATPTPTRSPESYVTEAEALYKDGKLLQAIDAYQAAINASPQDPALYIAIARVQVFARKYTEAQANAENALLLDNTSAMAHAVRAWALDFQLGKNSEALDSIQQALKLDDRNPLIYAYYTEILTDSGFDNYAQAAEASKKALALGDLLETHRARAYILDATGNYEEAIAEYQSAIAINSNIPILHIELGMDYRILQVYDKAIAEFTRADTLNPPDPEPDYLISRTNATVGKFAQALQYAENAVKDNPTDPKLRGNYGVMFYRNLLWPEAVQQLTLAIHGGKADDGSEIVGLELVNDPLITEYYSTYGLALARTNQCGEGLQIAQEIQSKVPSNDDAVFAASEIIRLCQENLDNPPLSTSTSSITEATATTEAESITPTP